MCNAGNINACPGKGSIWCTSFKLWEACLQQQCQRQPHYTKDVSSLVRSCDQAGGAECRLMLSPGAVTHLPWVGSQAPLVPWRGRIPLCRATCCQTAPQGPVSSVQGAAAVLSHHLRTQATHSHSGLMLDVILSTHNQQSGVRALGACRCKQSPCTCLPSDWHMNDTLSPCFDYVPSGRAKKLDEKVQGSHRASTDQNAKAVRHCA